MKLIFKFSLILLCGFILSCTSNKKPDSQGDTEQTTGILEEIMPVINNYGEFNKYLAETGITLPEGLEFVEFLSKIPKGASQDPIVFSCTYKVKAENYKLNEETLMNYFKKIYNDSLKSKAWTISNVPNTGIMDFHNHKGEINTISVRITQTAEAVKKGQQDIIIDLWQKR